MNTLVSIITPTYNHELYIGEAIETVLTQSYPHWEMIIIDDGSTDRTPEIVAQYKDPRIKYVRQENKGIWKLGETYNKALSLAKGELIAILEGDDYWAQHKLRAQVEHFKDPEVILSYGTIDAFIDKIGVYSSIPSVKIPLDAKNNNPIGSASFYMMQTEYLTFTFPASVVIRKSALEKIGGFQQPEYLPVVDYPTFLALSFDGRFAFHPNLVAFWRRHKNSSSKSLYSQILDGVYHHINETLKNKKLPLTSQQIEFIQRDMGNAQSSRYTLLGRLCLKEKDWKNARRAFNIAKSYLPPTARRVLITMGVLCSYLHCDYEGLFDKLSLSTATDLLSNQLDPMISKQMLNSR